MPTTITKTLYTFGELLELRKENQISQSAVELARNHMTSGLWDYEWWQSVYEIWKDVLKSIGFLDIEFRFRLSYTQGDGAVFTAAVDVYDLILFLSSPVEPSETVSYDGNQEAFGSWIVNRAGKVRFNPKFRRLLRIPWDYAKVKSTGSNYYHERTAVFEADFNDHGDWNGKSSSVLTWTSDYPRVRRLADEFIAAAEDLRLKICQAIYYDLQAEYEYQTSDLRLTEDSEDNSILFDKRGRIE